MEDSSLGGSLALSIGMILDGDETTSTLYLEGVGVLKGRRNLQIRTSSLQLLSIMKVVCLVFRLGVNHQKPIDSIPN